MHSSQFQSNNVTGSANTPLKVIVVGGGCGGLALAHALHKAGMDYVVLDKHEIAPAWGGSITIMSSGCRILDQLGVLDDVAAKCKPCVNFWERSAKDGSVIFGGQLLGGIGDRLGYMPLTLERRRLLESLYDTLPDKSKIFSNKRVHDIEEIDNKVRVFCTDGTMHEGDLVVGADGVHSVVRDVMWKRMAHEAPEKLTVSEKQTMKAQYKGVVGCARFLPGMGDDAMTCVTFDKSNFMGFSQPDGLFFTIYVRLPDDHTENYVYPNRKHWTQDELEETVKPLLHYAVTDKLTFGDIWNARIRANIVSLEEGCLQQWSHGRMVLTGDAVHKLTPNLGYGGSLAMEDAVALANELHRACSRHPNKLPSDVELTTALDRFVKGRLPRIKEIMPKAAGLTRMQAHHNILWRFVYRVILPYVLRPSFLTKDSCWSSMDTPTLNYAPFKQKQGTMQWVKSRDPDNFINDPKWIAQTSRDATPFMVNGVSDDDDDSEIVAAKAHARHIVAKSDPDVSGMAKLVFPVVIISLTVFLAALIYVVQPAVLFENATLRRIQRVLGRGISAKSVAAAIAAVPAAAS